jgi:hypothetical protein
VTAVAAARGAEYLRGMPAERAAILLLTGCSLKGGDPRPVEDPVEPWGPPSLQVTPDAVDFGVVDLGESVITSIELANVGGDDLVLDELRLAYADPSVELRWDAGKILAAGASADLSLTWSPDRAQALESKLRIGSNDPVASIIAVWLTGSTATPAIQIDPTSLDFGKVPIGSTFEQSVMVTNIGYADLHVESVGFMSSDPSELEMEPIDTPIVVLAGTSVEARISYTPEDEDDDHAVLIVDSDDPWTPTVHAEVDGTGVASPDTGT